MVESLISEQLLRAAPPRQLLATYEAILAELRARMVVRTNDAPSGQYAEWLAWQAFGGRLAPNSEKSFDLEESDYGKVQVKARVLRNGTIGERQLSPFRTFGFDYALVVLFDSTYDVAKAAMLGSDLVEASGRTNAHVNGRIVIADALLAQGVDVTERLRKVSSAHPPSKDVVAGDDAETRS